MSYKQTATLTNTFETFLRILYGLNFRLILKKLFDSDKNLKTFLKTVKLELLKAVVFEFLKTVVFEFLKTVKFDF